MRQPKRNAFHEALLHQDKQDLVRLLISVADFMYCPSADEDGDGDYDYDRDVNGSGLVDAINEAFDINGLLPTDPKVEEADTE